MLKSFVQEARSDTTVIVSQMQVGVPTLNQWLRKEFRARILLTVRVFRKGGRICWADNLSSMLISAAASTPHLSLIVCIGCDPIPHRRACLECRKVKVNNLHFIAHGG